ncbi:MAG: hypothetical protein ACYCSB_06860 [bacterium]
MEESGHKEDLKPELLEAALTGGKIVFFIVGGHTAKPLVGIGKIAAKGLVKVLRQKKLHNVGVEEICASKTQDESVRGLLGPVNEIGWDELERILSLEKTRTLNIDISQKQGSMSLESEEVNPEKSAELVQVEEPDKIITATPRRGRGR